MQIILKENTTYQIKRSETNMTVHKILREDDIKIVFFGTHRDKLGSFISCMEYHLNKEDFQHWEESGKERN